MSWFEDSNIKKSYIVQTVSDVGIFSACTQIYLTNISPCAGDTINITGNLGVSGNISGTTYFGDGSQLSGIVTTDNFVTGGVYSASSETLYFTGTTGFTPFSVDVSALLDNTNNFVTGGTYNSSTDIVTLTRNDNVNINITGVSNTFTTGATYNEGTELITFVRNDGNSYTADLAAIASATTNSFTTGATLNGNIIEFANSVLGLNYYNVDLTSIVSGVTNSFTTGATLNGNIIEFANNLLGLDYYNVDLTSLVSGKLDTTTFNTYSGTVETQINNKTENTNFTSHTGDTTIHYTKGSINLSELGSSAHTHSISEVINLQTDLDGKLPTTTFNSYTGSVVDVFVSSGNANAGTQQLSFTNTTGGTFNVTNSASLFSDNDINVTGGTYDTNTGCVTFVTNSGTSFDVCGFVTGITDTFVTGGTLTGENLVLERNSGVDVGNIDLSGLVSGKLEISLFNTYTGDTQTALGNKTDNTNFVSHTGDTTIHYTKGSINLSELGSSAHTHSISEVVNLQTELDAKVATTLFNTYTGDTETALGTKTTNTNFTSHTGDTTIHYTKGSINLSDLGSSAHTHSISEVINLQNNLDAKVATTLFNTYTGDTETTLGNKLATTTFNSYTGSVVDVFVSSGNVNAGAQQLSFTNTTGGTFNVTNASALFSDNDVNVTGGTYNINTGCVTFITNSATTFDVCGFVTGITDTFVTGGTLSGDNLVLERSSGVDVGNIDLSGLISNSALVGSYLDERVARWNSTTNTLQNGLIRDDGTTTSIGNGPSASNLFYVDNTSLTTSILGQTQDGNSNQTHSIRAINKNGSANNNTYATGILAESRPTGTPSDGIYTAGRFIQGNFSEYSSASQLELTALQIQVDTTTGSDELHGINFDKFDINDAVSGNAYAIKIGGFTGAGVVSGTKYGIYQSGSEKNYFGGQLQLNSVGAATPVTNLGVDASGYIVSGTTGASEIGELSDAIYLSANENLGLGDGALVSVTTGAGDQRNVAVGNDAGNKWSGGYSVFIGSKAGDNAVTGNYNVAIGADALGNAASCNTSIAIGSSALAGSTGVGNIGIGNSAGSSITSGGRNIFIGRNANGLNTSSYQIAIGDLSTTQASSLALGRSGIILLHGEFATAGRTKLGINLGNTYSAPTANLQVKGHASDTTTFLVENGSGSSIFQVDEDGTITGNGLGDVSKVGTPVNNQIGVWTGDGTIEGDSNLIWGGSTLQVGNSINSNISQVTSTYLASKVETNDANLLLYGYGDNGTNSGEILLAQARGTIDSPTSTQSGDILGDIGFMGATGAPAHREAARIRVFAGENFVDGTNYGSIMKFSTSTIGNATVTDRYVIDGSGEHNFTGNVNITSGLLNLANTTSGTPVTNLAVDSSGNVVEATASNDGVTTVKIFNATPDQELYDDGNIEIHLDDAATDDIEVKVLTNPSSGNVQFGWWSPSDTSAGSASLNIASGQTPLNGNFGDDDTMQIRIFAPNDSSYPYWEVNITKGPSGDPLVIRVTKWASYD